MGFVLQARKYQTQTIVGAWNLDKNDHEFIGILKCFGANVLNFYFNFTIFKFEFLSRFIEI